MNKLTKKLSELINNKMIQGYLFQEDIPDDVNDKHSRTADTLEITFNNGETLKLTTVCSGVLENTSIILDEA